MLKKTRIIINILIPFFIISSCTNENEGLKPGNKEHLVIKDSLITEETRFYYVYSNNEDYLNMARYADSLVRLGGFYNAAVVFWSDSSKIPKPTIFGTIPDSLSGFGIANYTVDEDDFNYKLFANDGKIITLKHPCIADSTKFDWLK